MDVPTLYLLKLHYKSSPIEIREKFTYSSKEDFYEILNKLIEVSFIQECVVLSTCNRTEYYIYGDVSVADRNVIKRVISKQHKIPKREIDQYFQEMLGSSVVKHLFETVSGLNSLVLGENQILGQVKHQFFYSQELKTSQYLFNQIFNLAISVGKRVRTETHISEGMSSIPSAAIEVTGKIFKNLSDKVILLIGAGAMAQLTLSNLVDRGCHRVYIANRTLSAAKKIADKVEGTAVELSSIYDLLYKVDIVISAIVVDPYLIDYNMMQEVQKNRTSNSLLMIDLSLPRSFDPRLNGLGYIFLHNIDDLEMIVDETLADRQTEVVKVKKIIDKSFKKAQDYLVYHEIQPFISQMYKELRILADNQVNKHKLKDKSLEYAEVSDLIDIILKKIIEKPISRLKKLEEGNTERLAKMNLLKELFFSENRK